MWVFFCFRKGKNKNLTHGKIYLPLTPLQSWSSQRSQDTENFAWPPLESQLSTKHLSCDFKKSQLGRVHSVLLFKVNKCPHSLILEALLFGRAVEGREIKTRSKHLNPLLTFTELSLRTEKLSLTPPPTSASIDFILNTPRWLTWSLQIAHKML